MVFLGIHVMKVVGISPFYHLKCINIPVASSSFSVLVCCLSSVSLRRIVSGFLNKLSFDYTTVAVSGKVERS